MAVTRVTTGGSASQIATGLNPTIAKSALSGLQDGDLLVASISQNGSTIGSGPSNWFSEGDQVSTSNPRLSVWTHYVSSVAAEPASWVWTLNSSVAYSIQVTVFRAITLPRMVPRRLMALAWRIRLEPRQRRRSLQPSLPR